MNASEFESLKREIVKEFFAHDVIKINTKEFFVLSSGIQLPLYLDHRLIFSFPDLRKKIINAWVYLLSQKLPNQTQLTNNKNLVFAGTATAGIAPAYALSAHTDAGFIYIRDKSKAYGLKSQIEGYCQESNEFIVVDDMVVTAGSILKSIKVLQNLYSPKQILCATSISCHESYNMRQSFKNNDVDYISIFTTIEIFTIAHEIQIIDKDTFEIINKFLKQFDKRD